MGLIDVVFGGAGFIGDEGHGLHLRRFQRLGWTLEFGGLRAGSGINDLLPLGLWSALHSAADFCGDWVLVIVFFSYRQTIAAYRWAGSYTVAREIWEQGGSAGGRAL